MDCPLCGKVAGFHDVEFVDGSVRRGFGCADCAVVVDPFLDMTEETDDLRRRFSAEAEMVRYVRENPPVMVSPPYEVPEWDE